MLAGDVSASNDAPNALAVADVLEDELIGVVCDERGFDYSGAALENLNSPLSI